MAYHLKQDEAVDAGIRRIAKEQIDRGIDDFQNDDMDPDTRVHQVRKRCKKLRGLVRLVRDPLGDVYGEENAWYRDFAKSLAGLRDAGAMVETAEKLRTWAAAPDGDLLAAFHDAVQDRLHRATREETDIYETCGRGAEQLQEARKRIKHWPLKDRGFALLADGLQRTYKRGRRDLKAVRTNPTPEGFHEWRKRVKYHWYHIRLVEHAWPDGLHGRRTALKALSDILGDDHDLLVLLHTLEHEPGLCPIETDRDRLSRLIHLRKDELQNEAIAIGRRLYAEKAGAFTRRIRTYWDAWQDERRPTA